MSHTDSSDMPSKFGLESLLPAAAQAGIDRPRVVREGLIEARDQAMKQWPDAIPFTVLATHAIWWLSQFDDAGPTTKEDVEGDLVDRMVLALCLSEEDQGRLSAFLSLGEYRERLIGRLVVEGLKHIYVERLVGDFDPNTGRDSQDDWLKD